MQEMFKEKNGKKKIGYKSTEVRKDRYKNGLLAENKQSVKNMEKKFRLFKGVKNESIYTTRQKHSAITRAREAIQQGINDQRSIEDEKGST